MVGMSDAMNDEDRRARADAQRGRLARRRACRRKLLADADHVDAVARLVHAVDGAGALGKQPRVEIGKVHRRERDFVEDGGPAAELEYIMYLEHLLATGEP